MVQVVQPRVQRIGFVELLLEPVVGLPGVALSAAAESWDPQCAIELASPLEETLPSEARPRSR